MWGRKGRFHSCAKGCRNPAAAVRPSSGWGRVQRRRGGVFPAG
eukprot:gene774-23967_t